MKMHYSHSDFDALMQKLDRQNISYYMDLNCLVIKLNRSGSNKIFMDADKSIMILDNEYKEINLDKITLDKNVYFLKHSLKKNYLLFALKENNEKLYDNFLQLSNTFYKLDYERKTYLSLQERIEEITIELTTVSHNSD